jgi:hypothetical protein
MYRSIVSVSVIPIAAVYCIIIGLTFRYLITTTSIINEYEYDGNHDDCMQRCSAGVVAS